MNSLIWFRNDLRITDNTAVYNACQSKKNVIATYIINPKAWKRHKKSPNQVSFILRRLHHLKEELSIYGIPLVIQESHTANPEETITKILHKHNISQLYFNKLYEHDELSHDKSITQYCTENNIHVHSFHDRLLAQPDNIHTQAGTPYTVFTPFKRTLYKYLLENEIPKPLPELHHRQDITIKSDKVPTSLPDFTPTIDESLWPAHNQEADNRLKQFCESKILSYETDRDLPSVKGTSTLSPYLAIGAISARQCLDFALSINKGHLTDNNPNVDCWISELVWREFYTHILIHFPHVCRGHAFKKKTDTLPWSQNKTLLNDWKNGNTGIPIIDASMRQLVRTGWMHNRLRMISAMYLTKNCFINWREGEAFFLEHLIDGDFASNNGGWQWAASTGTDAAPYFRIMNPIRQSERFDPEGKFIKEYCPELSHLSKKIIHDPTSLSPVKINNYPQRKVDLKSSRLNAISVFKKHIK